MLSSSLPRALPWALLSPPALTNGGLGEVSPWLPGPGWFLPFLLGYLLLFLLVRVAAIAYPSWALAWAQLEGLRAEWSAQEDIQGLLRKAEAFLHLNPLCKALYLLFWSGGREMAAWVLMHRAERRAADLLSGAQVEARLRQGLGEVEELGEKGLHWREELRRALEEKAGEEERRALLACFLAELYGARDTRYARLLTLQNKGTLLLLLGLALALVLATACLPGLDLPLGWAFLLGFLGGVLSRLLRVVAAGRVSTDYGAYWVPLFLAPVLGGLGAMAGYLVLGALLAARLLGEGLAPLAECPALYGVLVVLGFSERFLVGLTGRLEAGVLSPRGQEPKASPPSPQGGSGAPEGRGGGLGIL
ncbi:hypothetical protein [Thermus sp.]|uniref:hypothetical protein n=1 Tax=Thermus sp. TaxID=275 RepID=UPI00307E1DBD